MFDLCEVGVGIAVIDQRVQKFGCFPNRLLPFFETKIFFLFAFYVIHCLIQMIEAVELRNARFGLRIVLAKFFFGLAFLIAAFNKFVPLIEIFQWLGGLSCFGTHSFSLKKFLPY